jgi:hypothetical protein
MPYTLRLFLFKMQFFFHNANLFGSVLFTFYIKSVIKLKKNNSGAKGSLWYAIDCQSETHRNTAFQGRGKHWSFPSIKDDDMILQNHKHTNI